MELRLPLEMSPGREAACEAAAAPCCPHRKRNRKGEKNGKGLRHFSMKVCEKVQRKGTTSYNEVADELVAEFSAADSHILPSESVSAPGRPPCRLPRVQRRPRNPWEGRFLTHWCREAVASL